MKKNRLPDVVLSILIVNFNGRGFLDACFKSIARHITLPHEIIVVDNASGDGSAAFIAQNYPEVVLIVSNANLGFAAGNNLAACSANGKYLLLLNNDTQLLDNIKGAIALLESNPDIGVLSGKMLGRDCEYRCSTGHFPSPSRLLFFSSLFNRSGAFAHGNFPADDKTVYNVDWVEGSLLLIRRELWQTLGGLDDGYFMYVEDIDLCKRVHDAGLRVAYFPLLSFMHYGGYSSSRLGMVVKGFRRYHRKFSGSLVRLAAGSVLTFGLVFKAAVYMLMSIVQGQEAGVKSISCLKALKDSPW